MISVRSIPARSFETGYRRRGVTTRDASRGTIYSGAVIAEGEGGTVAETRRDAR